MRQSRSLLALIMLLFCSSVLSQTFLPKLQKTGGYIIEYFWPVYGFQQTYNEYSKYTRKDYPCFNGDNFALEFIYPKDSRNGVDNSFYDKCSEICGLNPQANVGKISKSDYQYFEKYFYQFGQHNDYSASMLWSNWGCCTYKQETEFFSGMVKLHKKFNIIQALAAKNIVPHKTKLYKREDIVSVISQMLGGQKFALTCTTQNWDTQMPFNRPSYLKGLTFVVDEKLNPISHKDLQYNSCKDLVNFPPIEY